MISLFRTPVLTPTRIWMAFIVAIAADGIQMALGPAGSFLFADQVIDVIAMCLVSLLIGFHPMLIPTFVAELLPLIAMLPTWTGCVGVVVALRKRQQRNEMGPPPGPPPVPPGSRRDDVIDV